MALDSVVQHEQDPIVVVTYSETVRREDVQDAEHLFQRILQSMSEPALLIVIIDTLLATSNFADILRILRSDAQASNSAIQNMDFHLMIVGTSAMSRLYVDSRRQKQFGGGDVPMFQTVKDALAAAHTLIAQKLQTRIEAPEGNGA